MFYLLLFDVMLVIVVVFLYVIELVPSSLFLPLAFGSLFLFCLFLKLQPCHPKVQWAPATAKMRGGEIEKMKSGPYSLAQPNRIPWVTLFFGDWQNRIPCFLFRVLKPTEKLNP